MSIRRGTIYEVPEFKIASGLLILTNDEWNEADTGEISGALVFPGAGVGREPIDGTPLFAGPVLTIKKTWLTTAITQLDTAQMRPIQDVLTDVLSLDRLRATPPQPPPVQPGQIDYPRWSEVYYAGSPVGEPPQLKRHITVSSDAYNRAVKGAIFVRTSTSPRRHGESFPTLADGTKAICMLPTFISSQYTRLRGRDTRPDPRQFFLLDMAVIANGLRSAVDL